MKKNFLFVAIVFFLFAVVWTQSTSAQSKTNAISVKAGKYEPTGDIDDLGLDGELYYSLSFNHYFSPQFAVEFGVGKYSAEETFSGFDPVLFGSFSETDEIEVIPFTVNVKGISPLSWGELYGGVGLGLYLVDFEANLSSSALGPATISDSDNTLGFQLLAGILFNLTETVYFGLEGQYILTGDAEASGVVYGVPLTLEGDLNGFTISGMLGFRF